MSEYQPSRLDRIEAILEEIAVGLKETRQITESNARAIQAAETRMEEERRTIRQALDDLNQFVRSLTSRSIENMGEHEDFKAAMREFRDAMNEFRRWIQNRA